MHLIQIIPRYTKNTSILKELLWIFFLKIKYHVDSNWQLDTLKSSLFRYPSLLELKSNTYYLLILLGINIIHSMQNSSEVKSVL